MKNYYYPIVEISDEELDELCSMINKFSGVTFTYYTISMVENSLSERLSLLGFKTFIDYINYLKYDKNSTKEMAIIMDILTNNEPESELEIKPLPAKKQNSLWVQIIKIFKRTPKSTINAIKYLQKKDIARINATEPHLLCNIMANEHPQLIALFLYLIAPKTAAAMMNILPKYLTAEITLRISNMDSIYPNAIQALFDNVNRKLDNYHGQVKNGAVTIVEIFNNMDRLASIAALDRLEPDSPKLVANIRDNMRLSCTRGK